MEMLGGTDMVREVQSAGARQEVEGAGPESELGPAIEEEASDSSEWEDGSAGD